MMIPKWRPEAAKIEAMLKIGRTYDEIGIVYGVSGTRIRHVVNELELNHARIPLWIRRWEPERESIREMLSNGYTYQDIAIRYSKTRERVRQVVVAMGLDQFYKITEPPTLKRVPLTPLQIAQHRCFCRKRQNAMKQRRHEFVLSPIDIDWPTHCPILGMELDYFGRRTAENSPSFDRTDPKYGYVPGNVRIISWRANRIKNDGNAEEHRKIASYLENLTQNPSEDKGLTEQEKCAIIQG